MQTGHLSTYQADIQASPEKVWEALTNPEMVEKYFFGSKMETDWNVGSPLIWNGEYEGKSYVDKGVIQACVPQQKLSYTYLSSWSGMEDKPENYLLVTFHLKPVGEGTELMITQSNYDEERAKHSEANWKTVVDGLKKIVE